MLVKVAGQDGVTAGYASAPPAASGRRVRLCVSGVTAASSPSAPARRARAPGPAAAANASASTSLERVLFSLRRRREHRLRVGRRGSTCRRRRGFWVICRRRPSRALRSERNGLAPGANERVALGDWGYGVVARPGRAARRRRGPGYRGFVTAFHVFLVTKAHGGCPGIGRSSSATPRLPFRPRARGGPRARGRRERWLLAGRRERRERAL